MRGPRRHVRCCRRATPRVTGPKEGGSGVLSGLARPGKHPEGDASADQDYDNDADEGDLGTGERELAAVDQIIDGVVEALLGLSICILGKRSVIQICLKFRVGVVACEFAVLDEIVV